MSFAQPLAGESNGAETTRPSPLGGPAPAVGIAAAFLIHAVLAATWGSRLPALKAQAGLTNGQLGLTLFGLAAGMIVGSRVAGAPIDRYGSRPLTRYGTPAMCAVLLAPSLAHGPLGLAAALFVVGCVAGLLDVAINAQGVTVEEALRRPILSGLHGLWAVGLGVGAAAGALFAAAGASPLVHFAVVGGAMAVLSVPALRGLIPAARAHGESDAEESPIDLWSAVVVVLGAIAFCSYFSEGSMGDWSAVYLRDSLGAGAAVAACGFAAFSATMAASRFAADRLVMALGPVRLVRAACLVAVAGFCVAVAVARPAAVIAGFALVGAGLGPIVPVAYRAAGGIDGASSGRILGRVVGFGYAGTVVGPLLIGGAAQVASLRAALCLPIALVLAAAAFAGRLAPAS
jgi:fucose permease